MSLTMWSDGNTPTTIELLVQWPTSEQFSSWVSGTLDSSMSTMLVWHSLMLSCAQPMLSCKLSICSLISFTSWLLSTFCFNQSQHFISTQSINKWMNEWMNVCINQSINRRLFKVAQVLLLLGSLHGRSINVQHIARKGFAKQECLEAADETWYSADVRSFQV